MGGKWDRTPKRVRHDIEKAIKSIVKHDGALKSAESKVNEIVEKKENLSKDLEKLRGELTQVEFDEFYLSTTHIGEFITLVLKPFGNPEMEKVVKERIEDSLRFFKKKAIHKSDIDKKIKEEDEEHVVIVYEGDYGELVCEIYDEKNPDHQEDRRYRMRLIPMDLEKE